MLDGPIGPSTFDGWENHKLNLDDYNSGPAAPYNSWVLLDKGD